MLGLIGFVRSIEETPATIDSIVLHPIFQGALPIAVRLLTGSIVLLHSRAKEEISHSPALSIHGRI